jgi:hypothetical protein
LHASEETVQLETHRAFDVAVLQKVLDEEDEHEQREANHGDIRNDDRAQLMTCRTAEVRDGERCANHWKAEVNIDSQFRSCV